MKLSLLVVLLASIVSTCSGFSFRVPQSLIRHASRSAESVARYNLLHATSKDRESDASLTSSEDNDTLDSSPVALTRRNVISAATKRSAAILTTGAVLSSSTSLSGGLVLPASAAAATTQTATVPTIKLGSSSLEVSRTIQGYWQLAGGHGRYKAEDAVANMQAHFDAGITTLDTADIYGVSEGIVGQFVKKQPKAIPCTKFCCFRFLEEIDKAEVKKRIIKQCDMLQVRKLPLVAFFWSNYDVKRYVDVGLMLAELKSEGLIQEIGATNFDLKHLKELKDAGVPIVSNQVQLSALDRRPVQSGMADWCAENDVSLIALEPWVVEY